MRRASEAIRRRRPRRLDPAKKPASRNTNFRKSSARGRRTGPPLEESPLYPDDQIPLRPLQPRRERSRDTSRSDDDRSRVSAASGRPSEYERTEPSDDDDELNLLPPKPQRATVDTQGVVAGMAPGSQRRTSTTRSPRPYLPPLPRSPQGVPAQYLIPRPPSGAAPAVHVSSEAPHGTQTSRQGLGVLFARKSTCLELESPVPLCTPGSSASAVPPPSHDRHYGRPPLGRSPSRASPPRTTGLQHPRSTRPPEGDLISPVQVFMPRAQARPPPRQSDISPSRGAFLNTRDSSGASAQRGGAGQTVAHTKQMLDLQQWRHQPHDPDDLPPMALYDPIGRS